MSDNRPPYIDLAIKDSSLVLNRSGAGSANYLAVQVNDTSSAWSTAIVEVEWSVDGTYWSPLRPSSKLTATVPALGEIRVMGQMQIRLRVTTADAGVTKPSEVKHRFFTSAGMPPKVEPDFYTAAATGMVPGWVGFHKFGLNPAVANGGGFEAIWSGGGDYTGFPDERETLEVFSSDNDDAEGDTGARTIRLEGLDENFNRVSETIIMAGTTAVDTVNTYSRMNRAYTLTAGSSGANEGAITIRHSTTTANIFATLPVGYNQTTIACWTVPAGKAAIIYGRRSSLTGSNNADNEVRLLTRESGSVFRIREVWSMKGGGSSDVSDVYTIPKGPYPAKTDIKLMANSDVNNVTISAGFGVLYYDA